MLLLHYLILTHSETWIFLKMYDLKGICRIELRSNDLINILYCENCSIVVILVMMNQGLFNPRTPN